MGLLQNGFRHSTIVKSYGNTLIDGATPAALIGNFSKTACNRNQSFGSGISGKNTAVPSGSQPPYCWILPQEAGGIKTFKRGSIVLSNNTVGEMGLPRSATATTSFTGTLTLDGLLSGYSVAAITTVGQAVLDGDGSMSPTVTVTLSGDVSAEAGALGTAEGNIQISSNVIAGLIVSAAAQANLVLGGNTNIDGALESTATGTLTLSNVVDLVGALSGISTGTITSISTAVLDGLGSVDSTGLAALSGAITTIADGIFTASTTNTTDDVLTADTIAAAVMDYVVDSGYSFQQVTRLMSAILAGKTEIVDLGGGVATVTFRNLPDTLDAVVFDMTGSERITRTDDT